jgi:biotin operon repressor
MPFPTRNTTNEKIKEVTLLELMTRNSANFANPTAFLIDSTSPTEAALLQYFHKWIQYKKKNVDINRRYIHRGKMWLYVTLTKLHEDTGLCRETVLKTLKSLKAKGLLSIDKFNSKTYDKTKWYTLNYQETVILRLRFPETYDKKTITETFSNKLEEEIEEPIVYGVDSPSSTGQTKESLPARSPIPLIPSLITPSYDESPLRGNSVGSLRSPTRPSSSVNALTMHQVRKNGPAVLTEPEKFSITFKHNVAGNIPHALDAMEKGKRLPMTTEHHSGLGDLAKKQGSEARLAKAKEKLNLSAKVYVAEQFWFTLMSHYEVSTFLSLTQKEKGMMKSLVKQLSDAKIPPGDFLEFVVANWAYIRSQLTWPDNPKKFRLAAQPFFQELVFNKNDIIRIWEQRETMPGTASAKTEYVYTRVEDIPKSHPNYAKLVQHVEITGKAVTYIKG